MRLKSFAARLALMLAACDSPADMPDVGSVQIRPDTNLALLTATEFQLNADVRRTDGSVSSERVTWKSELPQFATVDNTGLVRTAATYDPCWEIDRPSTIKASYCRARIVATAGARSDTLFILIKPRVVLHDTSSVSLAVGDSTPLVTPYATIDGERSCSYAPYGPGFISGSATVAWRNDHIVAVTPGQVTLTWVGPVPHLCFDNYVVVTTIQVTPR